MIYIIVFLFLTYLILTHSSISLYYAFHGLTLWYQKMIPSLLPFMILSGTLIRMNLSEKFVSLLHPVIKRIFRCNANVSYGIVMGFLCGFPMGAKTATDLLEEGKINLDEARYLMSFCNNIGPVYFSSFVIPLLQIENVLLALTGMYGIPLLYGMILRYTVFKNKISIENHSGNIKMNVSSGLLSALDSAVKNSIGSISMLCGYMIIFNLLNILPHLYFPKYMMYISPVLEITGGLVLSDNLNPFYILCLLPLGGCSCIAQTNGIIESTKISIREYILHKGILTVMTIAYYLTVYSHI